MANFILGVVFLVFQQQVASQQIRAVNGSLLMEVGGGKLPFDNYYIVLFPEA